VCGSAQIEQRDRAAELRVDLSELAARFRAAGLIPAVLVDALQGLGAAPVRHSPRVVIVGELGRGSRDLANRLAGTRALKTGPSQRDAAAVLDHDPETVFENSLLKEASIEVAPPLAAGAETTAEGVIPALMRADVVLFALSAAQLLSATERRLLTAVAGLTDAPLALAVGRMDVIDTVEDLDDTARRTERFRSTLSGAPSVFLLPADTDDAPRLHEWVSQQLEAVGSQMEAAWERRAQHLLSAVSSVLEAADVVEAELPTLEALRTELAIAHVGALTASRTRLEEGLSRLRDDLAARLRDMTPEQRVHEGAAELAMAVEALLRSGVDTWRRELTAALADAQLSAASVQAAMDRPDTLGEVTGRTPKLSARLPDQSYGLMAAAVGLSVGVLMLPAGGSGTVVMGLSLSAGSVAVAKVLRSRRESDLMQMHKEALDSWLREVGVRADDWLVDHLEGALERVVTRLSELYEHAVGVRKWTTPQGLARALSALNKRLEST